MNGVHDMGGMDGFGPIEPDPNEPLFHEAWERRAFALVIAMGYSGAWNIDMSRHARERIPPADYLASGYYEKWLLGLETLLAENGLVSREEMESGRSSGAAAPGTGLLKAEGVARALGSGGPSSRETDTPPRFKPGDRVRVRNLNPPGHTRAPRYIRCKEGVIERHYGAHVLPDSSAHGKGPDPQHLYSVRFGAREVWGEDASARDSVYLDLWDPYLDPA